MPMVAMTCDALVDPCTACTSIDTRSGLPVDGTNQPPGSVTGMDAALIGPGDVPQIGAGSPWQTSPKGIETPEARSLWNTSGRSTVTVRIAGSPHHHGSR
jgi:hypothetical protein